MEQMGKNKQLNYGDIRNKQLEIGVIKEKLKVQNKIIKVVPSKYQ